LRQHISIKQPHNSALQTPLAQLPNPMCDRREPTKRKNASRPPFQSC
jgi:hypothetical protein